MEKNKTFDSMYFLDVESIAREEGSVHVLEITLCHKLAKVTRRREWVLRAGFGVF